MKIELQGVEEIDNVINHFLADFDLTCRLEEEFCYYPSKNIIGYCLWVGPAHDSFMKFFQSLAPDITCDPFLISLLHEVGHNETYFYLEDEEIEFCNFTKSLLEAELENTEDQKERDALHFEYYNLPDEIEATTWAIDFIRKHPSQVGFFWETVKAAILNFYWKNMLVEKGIKNGLQD